MPGDLSGMDGGPDRIGLPGICLGRVLVAPAGFNDPMTVVLPDFDTGLHYEIPASRWTQSRGQTLPQRGDECLVLLDNRGDAWVPAFDGVPTFP